MVQSVSAPLDARVGIDVGGTFTDFVLFEPARGAFFFHKQPSTPADPALAVQRGLVALLEKSALAPQDIGLIQHGTTIGLNAIIQRRGARVGLVVSTGFRDILEIGRARMPSSFDFHATREPPFLPRDRVIEIDARVNAGGEPSRRPDDAELDRVAQAIRELNVDAVALVLINGYAAPGFEGDLADALQARVPDIAVLSAAQIWPEIREYERTLVAGLNAYIQPLMRRYFERLQALTQDIGVTAPILVTASNGGALSLDSALARPIDTVLSGPAAGVVAATRLSTQTGVPRILTFDMGGTSSDIAVAIDGEAEIATRTDIGGLPLVLPVVGVSALGAGGGSKVWVDEHGVLKVGPESTGADPGPASYDRGGMDAAITDCYLVTGMLDPAAFLGGAMPLRSDLARQALERVATALGFEGDDAPARAASGALAVATAQMASALHKALAQRGLDPAEFALVPFGGAGPTHANLLASDAELPHIVVPPKPGTYCALGAATADLRRDFVRSLRVPLDSSSTAIVADAFSELEGQAQTWLDQQGSELAQSTAVIRAADMRYSGQAYELTTPIAEGDDALTPETLAKAFHREHERIYGFRDTEATMRLGTIRLAIVGKMPAIVPPTLALREGQPQARATRPVFLQGRWTDADVYSRDMLGAGQSLDGPAVIEQEDTTVVVLPGWSAHTDTYGNLHITLQKDAA